MIIIRTSSARSKKASACLEPADRTERHQCRNLAQLGRPEDLLVGDGEREVVNVKNASTDRDPPVVEVVLQRLRLDRLPAEQHGAH